MWGYGSYKQTVISTTYRTTQPLLLTECIPSTRLEKIISVEKRNPLTDRRSLNRPSSWSVDGNNELEKKEAEKILSKERRDSLTVRCGIDGLFVRLLTQIGFLMIFLK